MSRQSTPPQPQDAEQTRRTQRHLEILDRLVEQAADIATAIHAHITQSNEPVETAEVGDGPHPRPAPAPRLVAAFDRTARTVRRTILLAQKLAEPGPAATTPTRHRVAARKQILRNGEDVIQRETQGEQAEALRAELYERVENLDDELDTRPAAEIGGEILRDLGLPRSSGSRFWARRTPADIAVLNARAAGIPASPPGPIGPPAEQSSAGKYHGGALPGRPPPRKP